MSDTEESQEPPAKRHRKASSRQKQIDEQNRDVMLARLQKEEKRIAKQKKELLQQDQVEAEVSAESQDEEDQGYGKQYGGGFMSGSVIKSKGIVQRFTQPAHIDLKRKLVREGAYTSAPATPSATGHRPLSSINVNISQRRAMSSPGPCPGSPQRPTEDSFDDLLDFADTPDQQVSRSKSQPTQRASSHTPAPTGTTESSTSDQGHPQLQPAPFRDGNPPGKNRKASDYELGVEKMLLNAGHEYACLVLSQNAFPDDTTKSKWARLVWKNACEEVDVYYELSSRMARLITDRDSWVRGVLKEACREHFKEHFKFKKGTTEETKTYNKNLRHALLSDDSFHHKNREEGTGYAEGPIIADIIETAIFEDESSDGVKYCKYFKPISTNLLALVFALLEFLIDEWSTGVQARSSFREKTNSEKFERHLKRLEEWTELSPTVTENIRMKLFKRLMTRAGAPNGPPQVATSMTMAMRTKVQQALQGRTGDTDSENDERQ